MLGIWDIAKVINKLAEGEDRETIERIAKKVIKQYPDKLPQIIKTLGKIQEFEKDQVQVTTARELSDSEKNRVKHGIAQHYTYPLNFKFGVNKAIGAGIIIRKGEFVIDNSLDRRINQLSETLILSN